MKNIRLIALMLAILTASSALFACTSEGDGDTTTTTAATTTEAPTTTTETPENPDNPENPENPENPDEADKPVQDATGLATLQMLGSNLRDLVTDTAVSESMTSWSDGTPSNLFDGNVSTTKLGGDVAADGENMGTVDITWKTSVPTTIEAFILYTGGDSAQYTGRTPTAWEFSGSTDGENWTVIDKTTDSGMADANGKPFGFTVDEPAAYTHYKFHVSNHTAEAATDTDPNAYLLQLNEMILIGSASDIPAETPAKDEAALNDLKAMGSDLAANVVVDSIKLSSSIKPWDDVQPGNLFDGDTATTKLGGDVVESAEISWKTDVKTTLKSYILYTGNDSASWIGRTPIAWVLYGSANNGQTWTVIDRVNESGMEDVNATPYGYTVDEPAAYKDYKLHIFATTPDDGDTDGEATTLLQLNEFVMIGDAEIVAE